MPANENGEGTIIALAGESVQQLLIAIFLVTLRGGDVAKIMNAGGQCGTAHACNSEGGKGCPFFK
jgi:hypothetical protein